MFRAVRDPARNASKHSNKFFRRG